MSQLPGRPSLAENTQGQVEYFVYEQSLLPSSSDDGRSTCTATAPTHAFSTRIQKPDVDLYRSHTCVKGWRLEAVVLFLSILGQVAIAVILWKIDGILLTSWTFYLSPNTVVSTISTAAKAGMLMAVGECISQLKWLHIGRDTSKPDHLQIFDDASRGPLGSLTFMWHGRRGSLGWIIYAGCLCTCLSIAVDPFSQQLLSFPLVRVQLPNINSSVTRSQVYDHGTLGTMEEGTLVEPVSAREPLLQQAAVSACFDVITALPIVCGGSNCTYPEFTSLGICSRCADVTSNTTIDCGVVGGSTLDCNITTPAGVELTAEWTSIGQLAGQQPTYTQFNTNVSSYDSIIKPNSSCEQCGSPKSADILQLGMARFGNGVYRNASDWQATLEAYDCTYSFCAQSFANWSTVNGDIVDGNRSRAALNAEPPTTENLYPFSTQDTAFPGDQTFMIEMEDHIFVYEILSNALQSPDGSTNGMSSANIGNFIFTALYDSPDLMATMGKIAASMSNRMLVNPKATTVYGGVFGEQTIIRVQWWWLSLPVILELIATLFLTVTVTQTHKARQYPWKSSLMPLLHGRSLLDTDKTIDDRDSLEMTESPAMSVIISERTTRDTLE